MMHHFITPVSDSVDLCPEQAVCLSLIQSVRECSFYAQNAAQQIADDQVSRGHRLTTSWTMSICHCEKNQKQKLQTYLNYKEVTTKTNQLLLIFHCVLECNVFSFFKG